jgi:hypothetical protein
MDDLKSFRQWGANTPGHPEVGMTPGVETTTGPLGQGVANSVGMALAARLMQARVSTDDFNVMPQRVFALCGDGDLMEGISQEAAALAGHWKLNNLVWLYDDNRITIDGDTSPNDTFVVWGGGAAADANVFETAVTKLSQDLARLIAKDGEGLTRLITVQVRGAANEDEANHVGRTIGTSPLVKTAVAGLDPNWGRILSAAGRAGVPFDAEKARVWVGDAEVYHLGVPHPEREKAAHDHLVKNEEVILGVDLGRGTASADIWTCDLTKDYVQINADYRS